MARRPTKRQTLRLESLETRQMLSGAGGSAVSVAPEVAPTAEKQYMLELVNLVRTNPREAAQRLTANLAPSTVATLNYYKVDLNQVRQRIANVQTRQPLAWNNQLARAAQEHSDDMASRGYQSHTGSDGSSPDQRIERAGYKDRRKTRENAFAYAESVDQAMQAFTFDWGVQDLGHLRNLTDSDSGASDSTKEIGFGITNSSRPGFAKVVTQDLGLRNDSPSYLLGVAYNDNDHDDFYTPGEGQGGVEIDLTDGQGRVLRTFSGDAGGYQIPLSPGRYTLRARVNGQVVREQAINMGDQNQKLDFVLNDLAPLPSQPAAAPKAAPRLAVAEAQTIAPPKVTPEKHVESNPTPVAETKTQTQPTESKLQDEALEEMFLGADDSITNWSTWSYSGNA